MQGMAGGAANEEGRKAPWESDAVAAPTAPGNAGGGKDGAHVGPAQGKHPLYSGIGGRMATQLDRTGGL
ncbi:MAG: hypothetical protein LBU32_29050 [Clostridiales bacterium]|jgi:hypothetical protein|nr:hypothetical protein [Clostridiales bacterium]